MQQGTWSQDEHDRFLTGVKIYPDGPWRMIARYVGTRSVRQVQTHAQKYHEKIARRMRGLLKKRNPVRQEHRIDGTLFTSTLEPKPLLTSMEQPNFSLPSFQCSAVSYSDLHATAFQFPDEAASIQSHPPSVEQSLLQLTVPPHVSDWDELLKELSIDCFAWPTASRNAASAVL